MTRPRPILTKLRRQVRAVRLSASLALLAFAALGLVRAAAQDAPPAGSPRVLSIALDGPVIPGTARYIVSAVREAEDRHADALLLRLDTPGGRLDSTREIVTAFLGAKVPIIVYVAPSGAHAGSAGMFITVAGHVAAMAPGTNIGAAHPVTGSGSDIEKEAGKTMAEKVENDTAAFARSIAQQRGRNVEWIEKAVRESLSATATEAVDLKVVDLVAPDRDALLAAVDGRTVSLPGGDVVLHTKGARVEPYEMTFQQKALSFLGDPNVAAVLGLLGMLGLLIELYSPGLIIPGAVGLFALLLAGIGAAVLPVNVGGIVLLLLAVGCFVAEVKVTSFGLLTLAGIGCLVLGSMLLIDTSNPDFYLDPSFRVSWGVIVPTGLLMSGVALGLMYLVILTGRRRSTTGAEGLVGETGRTRTEVGPGGGKVFVHGELWNAKSRDPIAAGEEIEVVAVRGLTLTVAQAPRA